VEKGALVAETRDTFSVFDAGRFDPLLLAARRFALPKSFTKAILPWKLTSLKNIGSDPLLVDHDVLENPGGLQPIIVVRLRQFRTYPTLPQQGRGV
jgi:hypothetical protein